jgi:thioredoxin-related protein
MIRFVAIPRFFHRLMWGGALCAHAIAAMADDFVPSPHAVDIPRWFSESFLDLREDIQDAAQQQRRLLIYFGQDGCPYCKALMQVTFRQPDIVARTRQHFVPVALNLWGDREVTWIDGRRMSEKELGKFLKVQFTPTLLFFDEQAKVVLRLNGYSPPEKFRVALDYVSRHHEKKQSFTDYVAATASTTKGAKLADEPFFAPGPANMPQLLKSSTKPVMVIFEQASCRECDELHREAFPRAEVRLLLERFTVVQADISGARKVVTADGTRVSERDWARALNVVYAPSLVFFDTCGKEVFRAEGYLRPFHIASALDYVASGANRDEPSFQRFIQKRADTSRAAGKRVEIWD